MYRPVPQVLCSYRFDDFEAEAGAGVLRKGGERVPLQDVPFRLLLALLAHPGEVRGRDELRAEVWPADIHLDFDAGLATAASKVRQALGDDPRRPRYLETLPGHGYRFLAPVEVLAPPAGGGSKPLRRPRTGWLAGGAVLALACALALALALGPWRGAGTPWDPRTVAILPLENRTGDPSLDPLGQQVVDLVRQDLQAVDRLVVAGDRPLAPGGEGPRRLAEATRARYLASGAFYLKGPDLEFHARVVDPWSGRAVYTLGPWRGAREDPAKALADLRQRLSGAIAWSFDGTWGFIPGTTHAPRMDAFLSYRRALKDYGVNYDGARTSLRQAIELDPEFPMATWWLCNSYSNQGNHEAGIAAMAPLEATYETLTHTERILVRMLRGLFSGRRIEGVKAAEELLALQPGSFQARSWLASHQIFLNDPKSAIRHLTGIPTNWCPEGEQRDWIPARNLCQAYYQARDHRRQLRAAREFQKTWPSVMVFRSQEAIALAALGDLSGLEEALRLAPGITPREGTGTAWSVTSQAMVECRIRGHREASRKWAEHLLSEWRSLGPGAQKARRKGLIAVYLVLDRLPEALATVEDLLAEEPSQEYLLGSAGVILARMGRLEEARRRADDLAALKTPFLLGRHTYQRARIAAQAGEKDRAVDLLRQALGQGADDFRIILQDLALEPLYGYPPYEALVKPKD